MSRTIQEPFTDAGQFASSHNLAAADADVPGPQGWTTEEHTLLLKGVAAEQSWEQISAEISEELNDRTPKACEQEFYRLARRFRESLR